MAQASLGALRSSNGNEMSDRIVLMFPGQGSQYPGMGKSHYENYAQAREMIDQANETLGFDLKNAMFNGSEEELKQTAVTQPAIFTISAALYKVAAAHSPELWKRAAFAAGHSLGEYSALFAAGAFDFQTGLKLVKYRGEFISEACKDHPGTMAAILGIDREALENLCAECRTGGEVCQMVNFNCPGQIVVAGSQKAIGELVQKASLVSGAKAIALSVSGAFHSSLVSDAALRMKEALEKATIVDTRIPVITNCDARPTSKAHEIRQKLFAQIDHPVLWESSIRHALDQGIDTFVEIGPGRVLTGLMRKIDRKMKSLNIDDADSMAKALAELGQVQSSAQI